MSRHPIELAYCAKEFVPTQQYQQGQRRKMHNPVRTTPELVKAMTHLGQARLPLAEARRRAKRAIYEPKAVEYIDQLGWPELLDFLDTIAIFLKAAPQKKKEQGMRKFNPTADKLLTRAEIGQKAIGLADSMPQNEVNLNKLKKMGGHVAAARDKWEVLAGLARFYPRKGISKTYVDALVEILETTELRSFKQIVAQSLIFHEANEIKEKEN